MQAQDIKTGTIRDYIKIARLDHWIKQLFIIPGIAFAMLMTGSTILTDTSFLFRLLTGFAATCFIASANYVINEWLDADFDKYHPTKKNRPVVTANLKPTLIITEYLLFTILGLCAAIITSIYVFMAVLALWIMGIVYNVKPIRTKEIPFIDVLSESVNNALRLLIGWFIVSGTAIPPISIVFGYWMGGAFLMATKRFAEYRMIGDKTQAGLYRKSFKYYTEQSLLISSVFYALLSVFFCGIYMIKYRIEFLIAIPFLCGLFCYYLHISYKYDSSAQKPEKLFKEKGLILYVLLFIVLVCVLAFVKNPFLDVFLLSGIIGA